MSAPSSSSFLCLACDDSFADETQRNRHRMEEHRDLNVACFCLICGTRSSNKFKFHEHFREDHSDKYTQLRDRVVQRTGHKGHIKNQLWITDAGSGVVEEEGAIMARILARNEATMNERDERRAVQQEIHDSSAQLVQPAAAAPPPRHPSSASPSSAGPSSRPRRATARRGGETAEAAAPHEEETSVGRVKREPDEEEEHSDRAPSQPIELAAAAPAPRQSSAAPSVTAPTSSRAILRVKQGPARRDAKNRSRGSENSSPYTRTAKKRRDEVEEEEDEEEEEMTARFKSAKDDARESFKVFGDYIQCDHCDVYLTLETGRFKCSVCPDYDLCAECEEQNVHWSHHLVEQGSS